MRKMVFRFAVLAVVLVATAAVLPAAPACLSNTTIQALIGLGSVGCQSQDKIFNNFSYDAMGGTVGPGNVTASIVLTQGLSTDIHGWLFSADTGSWTTSFTLGFTITVDTANYPLMGIIGSKDQLNAGFSAASVTDSQGMTMSYPGNETKTMFYAPVTTRTTFSTATIASGSAILSYEQDFVQSAIPEPMSFVLIGTGLLGFGLIRRRVRR